MECPVGRAAGKGCTTLYSAATVFGRHSAFGLATSCRLGESQNLAFRQAVLSEPEYCVASQGIALGSVSSERCIRIRHDVCHVVFATPSSSSSGCC